MPLDANLCVDHSNARMLILRAWNRVIVQILTSPKSRRCDVIGYIHGQSYTRDIRGAAQHLLQKYLIIRGDIRYELFRMMTIIVSPLLSLP